MLRILICWHFEIEQPVTCGHSVMLTNILIMQIENHSLFNYHRSNHWSSLIRLGLFIHNHISIPLTSQLHRTAFQPPADITNLNSIPASLEDVCNKMLRAWTDKWAPRLKSSRNKNTESCCDISGSWSSKYVSFRV